MQNSARLPFHHRLSLISPTWVKAPKIYPHSHAYFVRPYTFFLCLGPLTSISQRVHFFPFCRVGHFQDISLRSYIKNLEKKKTIFNQILSEPGSAGLSNLVFFFLCQAYFRLATYLDMTCYFLG